MGKDRISRYSTPKFSFIILFNSAFGSAPCVIMGLPSIGINKIDGIAVLLRFGGTRKCLSSDYSLRKATLIPGSSSAIRGVIVLCPAYIPLSFPGHTSTVDICTVLSAAFSHILTLIGRTSNFLQDIYADIEFLFRCTIHPNTL